METLWVLPPARDEALHLWSEDERRPVSVSSQRGRLEGIPWLNFTWRGVHKTDMNINEVCACLWHLSLSVIRSVNAMMTLFEMSL